MNLFLLFQVGMGGALGAISRMLISNYINRNFSLTFPIGILTINILGSFIIGLIMGGMYLKVNSGDIKFLPFLITGFLGGFTTFSQFSFDVVQLQNTSNLNTLLYVVFSLFLSVIALCIGIYLGNKILN